MLPDKYKKKSFLKFDIGIDNSRLLDEYKIIPKKYWLSSYWGDVHCSVGMLLLRGGNTGTQSDFFCDDILDHEILVDLPYIRTLLDKNGPFGGAKYAFLFRTIPNGITKIHKDTNPTWFDMYRIHIPIITNPNAFLISNEQSIHFKKGYAWTFDNQSSHGVVNGNKERVHLIFDVEFNEKIAHLIDSAEHIKGKVIRKNIERISTKKNSVPSYPGDESLKNTILSLKRTYNLSYEQIAEHFNAKNIPSKNYGETWTSESISKLVPAIFI